MKFIATFILFLLISSCEPVEKKESRFDNLSITDTICRKEIEIAKKHLAEGKLIYCDYRIIPLDQGGKEIAKLLRNYDIKYKKCIAPDVFVSGQTNDCFGDYLQEKIEFKYGKSFTDSLINIADSLYISKNLDKIYDYSNWEKPPIFPGDKTFDPTNHSGLQAEFEKLVHYPNNYKSKADSNSLAMVKIYLDLDEQGNANAKIAEFVFWNHKTNKDNFNTDTYERFENIIIPLIEQTKWKPAKIKSFSVKSKSQIFVYLK